jgi:pseudouridine-5'-phosphate glycosidase
MEVLETQGVPVIGLGTDTLPAFYTRSSGLPLDARVDSAAEAAAIIQATLSLGLGQGILITVPVPAEAALTDEVAESAIATANQEALTAGIRGKAVTPFLLERVVELAGEQARRANTALLVNNAGVAAAIAGALMAVR